MANINYYILAAGLVLAGLFIVACSNRTAENTRVALTAGNVSEHDLYQEFLAGNVKAIGMEEIVNPAAFWRATGEDVEYTYTDLNSDETDELIVRVDNWPSVFTVKDGEVLYSGNGWYSGVSGFEISWNGDVIIHDASHDKRDWYFRYRMNDSGTFDLIDDIGHQDMKEDLYIRGEQRITPNEYETTIKAMTSDVRVLNWETVR